ncbi:MAG TPA: hypothetical protein VFL57_15410 [Bryobacteraceae bacterium]|nr:hypothetical protein [Bryobacteraceae bacterium]
MIFAAFLACGSAAAAEAPHPLTPRTTPPIVNSVYPKGVAIGTTSEITVEGLNLSGATAIHFSKPGITGRIIGTRALSDLPDVRLGANGTPSTIDVGPLPPRVAVTVEVSVGDTSEAGPVSFRLQNHLGTSPTDTILIEPKLTTAADKEPDNMPEQAIEAGLPAILTGEITRPGDVDVFRIRVAAGDEITFDNPSARAGSALQPVLAIIGEDRNIVREETKPQFTHRFLKPGTYYVRVGDYQQGGSMRHFYRIRAGKVPLPAAEPDRMAAELTMPDLPKPDVAASGSNLSAATAQSVPVPATISGKLSGPQYFRFAAKKGQKLIVEAVARRSGSEVDSIVDVLDREGKAIEIATVRAVAETTVVLRDHGSTDRGIRLAASTGLMVGDYLMAGSEIMRIESLPPGPDDDFIMESFSGQRIAQFGTSPESHAIDRSIYKVRIHPPGATFAPNGLPLVRLYASNDDGGRGLGKDSYLAFTAPADGEYIVRLRDVRESGDNQPFRLAVRAPQPDFRLTVSPANPNVPAGGAVPVTVTALRRDGFDGNIDVSVDDLPTGLNATPARIPAGQNSTVVILSAEEHAKLELAAPLKIAGRASGLTRYANPNDRLALIALMPKPDIVVTAETREVTLEPGTAAQVKVAIARQNGFIGRVPMQVRNLPPGVRVRDVGLNGVLVNENETERSFTIEALPVAQPIEQVFHVAGAIETRASMQNAYAAPQPILLRVKAKSAQVAAR